MTLYSDLTEAENVAAGERPCPMCRAIWGLESGVARDKLKEAAAGTIGINTLVEILRKNGVTDPFTKQTIGRRTIIRHREGEHKP